MATQQRVRDPVCGMEVNPETASAKSEHMGQTYFFCGPGCKGAFDRDPAKYAQAEGGTQGHGGHQM